eukprot:Clim_evm1s95 gene=Clim_evmTU1s95
MQRQQVTEREWNIVDHHNPKSWSILPISAILDLEYTRATLLLSLLAHYLPSAVIKVTTYPRPTVISHSPAEPKMVGSATPVVRSAAAKLIPPFTFATATAKVRAAEDAWNSRDPDRVSKAYTEDSHWRNRSTHLRGRAQIRQFLADKWEREQEYRLIKELWAYGERRIAVRYQYEYFDPAQQQWYRAYGNENWQFADDGLMERRESSINDVAIDEHQRRFHWDRSQPRPLDHPGLIDSPE